MGDPVGNYVCARIESPEEIAAIIIVIWGRSNDENNGKCSRQNCFCYLDCSMFLWVVFLMFAF